MVQLFLGTIVHCSEQFRVRYLENGFLLVKDGKILDLDKIEWLEEAKARLKISDHEIKTVTIKDSQLLIPGLVDCHIHAPQYPNSGLGYDKPLLEWLDTYTYKLEKKFKDKELSKKVYGSVVRKTLDHGTTTACYFASLFNDSSVILADSAIEKGQRAFIGKINMIKLAPSDYIETPEESITETEQFVKEIKSKQSELVQPIITPRFALSVDMELMVKLAQIARDSELNIQTHISENLDEVQLVNDTYNMEYAETYDKAGLLTSKTVLAHGIYLSDDELRLLAKRNTSIAHCPESNTCLKSGMADVRRLLSFGVKVGLGTDVAGGPSPSIVRAMRSTIDTSIHLSYIKQNYLPLTYEDAFYLATLGGAEALALEDKVGNFSVGKDFDALLVDMKVEEGNVDYLFKCTPSELLQKFIFTGDDRNIVSVFVHGRKVK